QSGLKVYVDPVSLEYLYGATIDYVDGLMGAGFRIDNPNAVAACGCGSSFRTKSSGEAPAGGGCGCGN
ncbi:MAG: iron-sulfur cluster assembly accessory protein, partial [Chloroflexi bacterium]|nr:iron-sulfur cluster assembly accessory protein [Chloroflexota bacterium]